MIFVTVGTWKFDELVEVVDRAVGSGLLKEEITIQIGSGSYQPKHCPYFRVATTLQPYYEAAELVIAHGGATTFEVLSRGIDLISVANPHVQDNHQHTFLEALEGEGYLCYCRDLNKLPELIRAYRANPGRQQLKTLPWLPISQELEQAAPVRLGFLARFQPWFQRRVNKIRMRREEIEVVTTSRPLPGHART